MKSRARLSIALLLFVAFLEFIGMLSISQNSIIQHVRKLILLYTAANTTTANATSTIAQSGNAANSGTPMSYTSTGISADSLVKIGHR